MKAVAYYRVSTIDQGETGYSLPAQRERIIKYCSSRGFEIVREFQDIATASGAKKREDFSEMVKFLKKSEVRIVVATKVDRLFRNFRDYIELFDIEGIKVEFTDERIPDGATGQLLMDIRVAVARHFINNLREDTLKGMEKRVRQGLFVAHLPYGYRWSEDGIAQLEEEQAYYVRMMFELYATGRYSLSTLRQELKRRGMKNSKGKMFSRTHLHEMLRNPFYMGIIRWRGKLYEGAHEPIISPRLFERVQTILDRKRFGVKTSVRENFAYSGLVVCGYCGCAMTGEKVSKNGKVYKYYKCTGNRGKSHIRITERALGELFAEAIGQIVIPPSWVDLILNAIRDRYSEELRRVERETSKLKAERERLSNLIEAAYVDKLEGKISEEFWRRQTAKWNTRIQEIDIILNQRQQSDIEKLCCEASEILRLASKIQEIYLSRPELEHREILEVVCSNSRLYHGRLEIDWREPFDILAKSANCKGWLPGPDSNQRPSG